MKLDVTFLFCFILSLAVAHPSTNKKSADEELLILDLLDFVLILPDGELRRIAESHIQNDAALSAIIQYIKSDNFNALASEILAKPGAESLMEYLETAYIPMDILIPAIIMLIDKIEPGVSADTSASLRPLLDEIESALPMEDLILLWNQKIDNSAPFQELFMKVSDEERHQLVVEVLQMAEANRLRGVLSDMGVRVEETLRKVFALFGWGTPPPPVN